MIFVWCVTPTQVQNPEKLYVAVIKSNQDMSSIGDEKEDLLIAACVEQKTADQTKQEEIDGTPEWTDTRLCGRCQTFGSYLTFRSHCRICGKSICSSCKEPDVPDKWLDVPYVRLCRSIPDTHKTSMKACIDCLILPDSPRQIIYGSSCCIAQSQMIHARHWKEMATKSRIIHTWQRQPKH